MSASRESRSSMVPPATFRTHLMYWGLLAACLLTAAAASPAFNGRVESSVVSHGGPGAAVR